MTTPEQDKIIEALAVEHGAVKVLPLRGTDAVLACGWAEDEDAAEIDAGLARGLAIRWATGRLSHNNIMLTAECDPADRPKTLALIQTADAQEVAKWSALATMLAARSDADVRQRGEWLYVPADPAAIPTGGGLDDVPLRYAYEQEIADAHEQDAVRELLSAAGLRP